MFILAISLGVFSQLLFLLGLLGLLQKNIIAVISFVFIIIFFLWCSKNSVKGFKTEFKIKGKLAFSLVILFLLQALVNIIGALGPELAFDALWYHLTLPKLYLLKHAVYHIPGGLLYYSDMPKLGEMIYAAALSLGNEITAKLFHFCFGIASAIVVYKLTKKFSSQIIALLAGVIFYSNLVVAWESTTAYVDLIRTFYEIMALWAFINWYETHKRKWFYISAVMIGLAITTKLLAIGSLVIFSLLILWQFLDKKETNHMIDLLIQLLLFWFIALFIPLPWFIFSFIHTGNPFYPFFSGIYQIQPEPLSLLSAIRDIWGIFTGSADPISPLYIIFLPLVVVQYKHLHKSIKLIVWYSVFAIIVWYFTPRTGGGRFLMPYLPAMSIVCASTLAVILNKKSLVKAYLGTFLIGIILLVATISIAYRFIANSKFIPVIIGKQTKQEFLTNHLNFSFGDFYDTDNYLKENIKSTDKVLLYGFHNLYYVDFPFIDSSWVRSGDTYNYIVVQKAELPKEYKDWQLIYLNAKTMVKLYKPPKNTCKEKCIY